MSKESLSEVSGIFRFLLDGSPDYPLYLYSLKWSRHFSGANILAWRRGHACGSSGTSNAGAIFACFSGSWNFVCEQSNKLRIFDGYSKLALIWSPRFARPRRHCSTAACTGFFDPRINLVEGSVCAKLWFCLLPLFTEFEDVLLWKTMFIAS